MRVGHLPESNVLRSSEHVGPNGQHGPSAPYLRTRLARLGHECSRIGIRSVAGSEAVAVGPADNRRGDGIRLILRRVVPCITAVLDLEARDVGGTPSNHFRSHQRAGTGVEG